MDDSSKTLTGNTNKTLYLIYLTAYSFASVTVKANCDNNNNLTYRTKSSMLSCAKCIEGNDPEHFDVFNSKTSQYHGYNTQNGYICTKWAGQERNGAEQNIS